MIKNAKLGGEIRSEVCLHIQCVFDCKSNYTYSYQAPGTTHMPYLDFSVGVVCVDIHKVKNKELHRLTEMPALQSGEVQKHMDWYLKGNIRLELQRLIH